MTKDTVVKVLYVKFGGHVSLDGIKKAVDIGLAKGFSLGAVEMGLSLAFALEFGIKELLTMKKASEVLGCAEDKVMECAEAYRGHLVAEGIL